jgi:5-methyltetrahydropteroyltriglutamate--homocysteine methyltransferase
MPSVARPPWAAAPEGFSGLIDRLFPLDSRANSPSPRLTTAQGSRASGTLAPMATTVRADQVGSLLRPQALLNARQAAARGATTPDALREQEDAAILAALAKQKQVGLHIFTDGEFRRASWITDMAEAVEGFVPQSRTIEWHALSGARSPEPSTSNVVGGRLKPRRRLTGVETSFLKQHAPGPIKMTIPAPSNFWVVSWKEGVSNAAYASRSAMLEDATRILRDEVQALVDDGVDYVQLDAPFYGVFMDEQHRATLRQSGIDPDRALEEVVAADNAVVSGLAREGLTLGLHICRGNSRSRWLYEGGYNPIAETLFNKLDVDAFLLEYDSPRDGTFEPLRYVPSNKAVVLGLVTSKEPGLESRDALRRRIEEAAHFVPLERLALSPQCGFASVAMGNLLSEDDQWRKLALVVDTARLVWG